MTGRLRAPAAPDPGAGHRPGPGPPPGPRDGAPLVSGAAIPRPGEPARRGLRRAGSAGGTLRGAPGAGPQCVRARVPRRVRARRPTALARAGGVPGLLDRRRGRGVPLGHDRGAVPPLSEPPAPGRAHRRHRTRVPDDAGPPPHGRREPARRSAARARARAGAPPARGPRRRVEPGEPRVGSRRGMAPAGRGRLPVDGRSNGHTSFQARPDPPQRDPAASCKGETPHSHRRTGTTARQTPGSGTPARG